MNEDSARRKDAPPPLEPEPEDAAHARVLSPARLWLVISICIFAGEWLIMCVLEIVVKAPPWVEAFVDPTVLTLIVSPLLYLFLFRPMASQIARRRTAEEALAYSERKYHSLVENSTTGIYLVREWRIVYSNPAMIALLNRPERDILGANPFDFVAPEDREQVESVERRRAAGGAAPDAHEFRILTGTGERRWVVLRPVIVSFRGGTSILGTIADVTDRKRSEEELLRTTAALRELSSRVLTIQEEERARVARDLHEGVGQSLSALKYIVEGAFSELAGGEQGKSVALLRSAVPAIQAAIEEVRTMSLGLRPPILGDLGLVATLRWMSREFEAAHPAIRLEAALDISEQDVPAEMKIVLFRLLQEALNDAARHSASAISFAVERSAERLLVRIEDNGKRLSSEDEPLEEARSAGLLDLKERAELTGGRFFLHSPPGGGTSVRIEFPIRD